jgi:hypothetical protein
LHGICTTSLVRVLFLQLRVVGRRVAAPRPVRVARACALVVLLAVGAVPAHGAATVARSCGSDPLANTATVLCAAPSGPCSATSVAVSANIDVQNGGCAFDLGGRALTVSQRFQMTGAGFISVVNAGDVTITANGKLKARGDFVLATATPTPKATPTPVSSGGTKVPTPTPTKTFAATGPPGTIEGGLISLRSAGTITNAGIIDVSGDSAGSIELDAVGDVRLQSGSVLQGVGIAGSADAGEGDGGILDVTSHTGSITVSAEITMTGGSQAAGGEVNLTAARNIDVAQTIDASGGANDGGTIDIEAGDNITVTRTLSVDSNVGAGAGGLIILAAGEDVYGGVLLGGSLTLTGATIRMNGSDSEQSGAEAGELDASARGALKLLNPGLTIRATGGQLFDGDGGIVVLDSDDADPSHIGPLEGDLVVEGTIVLQSGGRDGSGGDFEASAGAALTQSASLDTSGAYDGGTVSLDAGGAVTVKGPITAQGKNATGLPGAIDITAGEAADAALTISQNIIAAGGAQNAFGDSIILAGCTLSIANGVRVSGQGGTNAAGQSGASDIELLARKPLQVGAAAQLLANPGGKILTIHPPGQNPVIGAGAVFNPARIDQALEDAAYPTCPVCGDGIRQQGEACDKGSAADGACCDAACTAFTCATATVTVAWTPTPTPTASGTAVATVIAGVTATATRTATPAATATRTPTPMPTATRTPTPTPTLTPTTTRTTTPTGSPTGTPSATPTLTPSSTPTSTSTASVASTPSVTVTPGAPTGRALAACQASAQKAVATLVAGETKLLQQCVASMLKCVQTKTEPAATLCRESAGAKCAGAWQAFRAKALAKLAGAVGAKCGPPKVSTSELLDGAGLGFGGMASECTVPIAAVTGVSECLGRAVSCRAEDALALALPRAADLLAAAGVRSGLCLPTPAGGLGGLPNAKPEGAAALACATAIAKASLATLTRALGAMQSCVALVLKCELTADVPATCVTVAAPKCAALFDRLAVDGGVYAKARALIDKGCAALAPSDLRAGAGLGFDLGIDRCAALGVPSLDTESEVASCVLRAQRCAAADILRTAAPRAVAALATVGQSAAQGLTCPAFEAVPAP